MSTAIFVQYLCAPFVLTFTMTIFIAIMVAVM